MFHSCGDRFCGLIERTEYPSRLCDKQGWPYSDPELTGRVIDCSVFKNIWIHYRRRYMAEILSKRRKTLSNHDTLSLGWFHRVYCISDTRNTVFTNFLINCFTSFSAHISRLEYIVIMHIKQINKIFILFNWFNSHEIIHNWRQHAFYFSTNYTTISTLRWQKESVLRPPVSWQHWRNRCVKNYC